jgi:hypothetical protein
VVINIIQQFSSTSIIFSANATFVGQRELIVFEENVHK